jgi:hypothetical protein
MGLGKGHGPALGHRISMAYLVPSHPVFSLGCRMRNEAMQTLAKPVSTARHIAKIERGMRINALRHLVAEVTWLNAHQIGVRS